MQALCVKSVFVESIDRLRGPNDSQGDRARIEHTRLQESKYATVRIASAQITIGNLLQYRLVSFCWPSVRTVDQNLRKLRA